METIEDQHGKSSVIITSQVPVNYWDDINGEETIADGIPDRFVHNALRISMQGALRRKRG